MPRGQYDRAAAKAKREAKKAALLGGPVAEKKVPTSPAKEPEQVDAPVKAKRGRPRRTGKTLVNLPCEVNQDQRAAVKALCAVTGFSQGEVLMAGVMTLAEQHQLTGLPVFKALV